jgi:hypothetical protein
MELQVISKNASLLVSVTAWLEGFARVRREIGRVLDLLLNTTRMLNAIAVHNEDEDFVLSYGGD